jgi:hypothetical protein
MCPTADWQWFGPIIGGLKGEASTARRIKRNFVPTHQLFGYGIELMREAELADDLSILPGRAEAYRNGLRFAFLALRPLRRMNITELENGTQLVETIDGYDVTIPRDVTKPTRRWNFQYRTRSWAQSAAVSATIGLSWPLGQLVEMPNRRGNRLTCGWPGAGRHTQRTPSAT